MKKETVIAIAIIVGLVAGGLYLLFTIQSPVQLPSITPRGNYTLNVVSTLSTWHVDDIKVWLFYASGEEGGVLVRPPLATRLGIVSLNFIREEDIMKWVDLVKSKGSNISGFVCYTMSIDNATRICRLGIVKPIEDPLIIDLVKQTNLKPPFVAYTPDGKLCWVAPFFEPVYAWIVNNATAKKYNVDVPRSWDDLIKPEYASLLNQGIYVISIYRLDAAPTLHSLHYLLHKYGWNNGWVYITYLAGVSIINPGPFEARDQVTLRRKALVAILSFGDAIGAKGFAPKNIEIVFPDNATPIRVAPIGITTSADEHSTYGMYELIKGLMTEAQQTLFMYRTGWNTLLGTNAPANHTNKMMVTLREQVLKEMDPTYNETWAVKISNITLVYMDILFNDSDVNTLLKNIVKSLASKYQKGEISVDKYYEYLKRVGEPIEFNNPITKERSRFTEDVVWQLVEASNSGLVDSQTLRNIFKEAWLNRLQQLAQELGI